MTVRVFAQYHQLQIKAVRAIHPSPENEEPVRCPTTPDYFDAMKDFGSFTVV